NAHGVEEQAEAALVGDAVDEGGEYPMQDVERGRADPFLVLVEARGQYPGDPEKRRQEQQPPEKEGGERVEDVDWVGAFRRAITHGGSVGTAEPADPRATALHGAGSRGRVSRPGYSRCRAVRPLAGGATVSSAIWAVWRLASRGLGALR